MLAPAFDVLRELGHALLDLLLAPFRHAFALATRKQRLDSFGTLQRATLEELASAPAPGIPLQDLVFAVGDASGEAHALEMLERLQQRHPGLQVRGFGGARLVGAGMEVWTPLADLNIMGFRDVAAQLPLFVRAVARFSRELRTRRPDGILLVDYPGLNRHLLRIAKRLGVPVVQYVAPQLWAWAPWRIRDFRRADRLLAILPFEADWYARHGAKASFIGHPLGDELPTELAPERQTGQALRIALLPGSRRREVRQNLPLLLATARLLLAQKPSATFVLPHQRQDLWPLLEEILATAPELPISRNREDFHGQLQACHGALVVSGTASLEAAMLGLATVVVYELPSRFAAWLARHALAVPWITSANLIAGRQLVPEHLGRHLQAKDVAADLLQALEPDATSERRAVIRALRHSALRPGSADRSVRALEQAIQEHRTLSPSSR